MDDANAGLGELWRWFAATQCRGYSRLYESIAVGVAEDDELLEMVRCAPPAAHMPLALLAAVHYLLLGGLEHPLSDVYKGRSGADPAPLFSDLCKTHRDEVTSILATRTIQTNDCGRSAVIGPGITWIASRIDRPLALVDVGASAGLNLMCDKYRIDYGDHGVTGPADSPVHVQCRVVGGGPPIAPRLPSIASRVGIDRSPVDVSDPDDARWLLACVWPDTGRLERTAASIRLAQQEPPRVVRGEANEVLPDVLAGLPVRAAAIVVTTWAFAYFSVEDRERFVELLERSSLSRRVAWLSAEATGIVETFSAWSAREHGPAESDVLGAVLFDHGNHQAELLARVHSHGRSINWTAGDSRS